MKKSVFLRVMLVIVMISFVLFSQSTRLKANECTKKSLSTMSPDECFELVKNDLPDSIPLNNSMVKNSIFEMIKFYEENPYFDGCFSSTYIDELNNIIQSFVLNYLGLNNSTYREEVQTRDGNQLLYNTLIEPYNARHATYNCYAYAIDRYESDDYYQVVEKFQPGAFSKPEYDDTIYFWYFLSVTIDGLAVCIKNDLEAIGYKNVEIHNAIPSTLDDNQKLICLRRGPYDYHFMRYDKDTDAWYHKPGGTAILRYDCELLNDEEWWVEYVDADGAHSTSGFYSGTIKYLTYYTDEIGISCSTNNENVDCFVIEKMDHIVKLFVECDGIYNFNFSSNDAINIHFYDYLWDSQTINLSYNNLGSVATFSYNLERGIYYIRVDFVSDDDEGNINVSVSANTHNEIDLNNNSDLTLLLHDRGDGIYHAHGKYLVSNNPNIYKITLECIYNNNLISVPVNAINVYGDSSHFYLLDRLTDDIDLLAQNKVNESSIFVFLDTGYSYFSIELPSNNYTSVNLYVTPLVLNEINQFDNSMPHQCPQISLATNLNDYYSSFVSFDIEQLGCFMFTAYYSINQNAKIIILKEQYDSLSNKNYLELVVNDDIYSNLTNYNKTINLNEGRYYIGYIDNYIGSIGYIKIQRYIDNNVTSIYNCLMIDPGEGYICGSQINLLESNLIIKSYNDNYITEGFTRIIYLSLDYTNDISRLDYNWYSSNSEILEVTPYGTVLAKSVTSDISVLVMAVNKNNPDIIYITEFIVENDLLDYQSAPININVYMTVEPEEIQYINLSNVNVPINYLQLYNWSTNSNGVTLYSFGRFSADESLVGNVVIIEGIYQYNSRVHIIVHISVEEE